MEVIKDTRNELFKRQELSLVIEENKNPGFAEVRKQISKRVGKPEENIDVRKVEGSFGKKKFNIEAHVYDSKENLDSINQLRLTKKQREEANKPAEEGNEKKEEGDKSSKEGDREEKLADGDEEKSEEVKREIKKEVVEERKKDEKEEKKGEEESKE